VAAIFSTSMLFGAPYVFRWMGGRGEMLSAALAYSNAAFSGAVCIVMLNILANAVRGTGNMTLPGFVIMGSVIALGDVHAACSQRGHGRWRIVRHCTRVVTFDGLFLGRYSHLATADFRVGTDTGAWSGRRRLRSNGAVRRRQPGPDCLSAFVARDHHIELSGRVPAVGVFFPEILKVGVPGLINAGITNLSVALSTGIASHLGREAAIGYAMGARLEYILIPIGFGFGTAISAMVGTNWGAGQYRRARSIGWTGAATVAATFATIGMVVALFPEMWMGLFSNDGQVVRLGTSYLQIMGPIYGLYGLGTALFFVTQGVGSNMWTMIANAVRLVVSSAGALIAICWLDLGQVGFFVAVAGGFCAYAVLATGATLRVKEPAATQPSSNRTIGSCHDLR
jgi:Na+-driven multidrug efflux pump